MIPDERQKALTQIATLAREHDLSLDEIGACLAQEYKADKAGTMTTRLFGYLGAALIFGGIALFIGMKWAVMPAAARVIVTYGTGLVAFIVGILASRQNRHAGAATPAFLMAAALLPFGMFVFLDEYVRGNDLQLGAMFVFGVMAFQFLVTFMALKRSSLLFFGYLFFNVFACILMNRSHVPDDIINLGISVSILMACFRLDMTPYRAIVPPWYFVGGTGLLSAAYDMLEKTPYDPLLVALSAGMMVASVRVRSRTLLFVSTLGVLAFLGYYTDRYFRDIVGWPVALIIMGFLLVGVSSWAVRLGQKIKTGQKTIC